MINKRPARPSSGPSFLAVTLIAAFSALPAAQAQTPAFETPDVGFKGRVSVIETPVVLPGGEVKLGGRDFKPGQEIRLSYGGAALGGTAPIIVDDKGTFRAQFTVPANAPAGQHPVVISASKPAAALVHPLKISPNVPLAGDDKFTATAQKLVPGLYQAAYSAKTDRIFVTSAVGRPPVTQSQLLKLNPQTLATETSVTPPAAPARPAAPNDKPRDPGLYAVYGVAVDDSNGTDWVTNTRQNTVAVYRQSDLSLVKQFEPGTVAHSRDVIVDEKMGKAYVSAANQNHIAVFETRTLQWLRNIEIDSAQRGDDGKFIPMSLDLDRASHKLYTVSLRTAEAAVIDTRVDAVERVLPVPGAVAASGVAFDSKTNRLLVAAQGSDNLIILDAASGKVLHDVKVGAGSLNVALDRGRGLAYVPNRGSGTVTVVNLDGQIVANLAGGTFPNHATDDGKGTIYAINKSRGADDPQGDRITRITPR